MKKTNWAKALTPLIKDYKDKKHLLDYHNLYEIMVMVLLAAQTSDEQINKIAPALFEKFPTLKSLTKADHESLAPLLGKVRNFYRKSEWLMEIARQLKSDENIPTTMKELTSLKGIGRKSANVIMREAEVAPEGIMVDLHVLRVVWRLGISKAKIGDKMEEELMAILPQEMWTDVGMALSFLGRDICHPTDPKHSECIMSQFCEYCRVHNT